MIGHAFPHARQTPYDDRTPASAAVGWWRSSLIVFAAIAVALLFAVLLLAATVFDREAQACAEASGAEGCCVATTSDAFTAEVCRQLP